MSRTCIIHAALAVVILASGTTGPALSQTGQERSEPPYQGTVWIDPDIIKPSDPNAFQNLTSTGRGRRKMFDRRKADWRTLNAWLFIAEYDDGLDIEIQVNPEFGSESAATVVAKKYGKAIGHLPTILRTRVETVWIHKGNHNFGGGNDNILIHTGLAESAERRGFLEEALVHEGVHTSLEPLLAGNPGWRAAQHADGAYISTYARENPSREDIAESFLPYLAIRYRPDRISRTYASAILDTMANRLSFFDSLSFGRGMSPVPDLQPAETFIEFVNRLREPVGVYWINYGGKEKKYRTLRPNEKYVQQTFTGHAWIVRTVSGNRKVGSTIGQTGKQIFNIRSGRGP